MKLNLYIHGWGSLTSQPDNHSSLELAYAPEPPLAGLVPPAQLRRTSKAVRLGLSAGLQALNHAGVASPAAICLGTAQGGLYDTEQFMAKMIAQDEQMLTPTTFIQSTHNVVAGQLALHLRCHGPNYTFVQGPHSFGQALLQAHLYLHQNPRQVVLAGAVDELTADSYRVMNALGAFARAGSSAPLAAGEGSSFFAVSDEPPRQQSGLRISHYLEMKKGKDEDCLAEIASVLQPGLQVTLMAGGQVPAEMLQELASRSGTSEQQIETCLAGHYATADAAALASLLAMKVTPASSGEPQQFVVLHRYCGAGAVLVGEWGAGSR